MKFCENITLNESLVYSVRQEEFFTVLGNFLVCFFFSSLQQDVCCYVLPWNIVPADLYLSYAFPVFFFCQFAKELKRNIHVQLATKTRCLYAITF